MRRLSAVVAFSLALASCGSGDGAHTTVSTSSPATPAVTTTTTTPPMTTATTRTTEATPTTELITTTAATRTTTVTFRAIVLGGDGLGLVAFGGPADDVLAILEEALGPPDELLDSREDIIANEDSYFYGGPDMTEVLAIWRPIGLFVAFSEHPFYREDNVLRFSGWAMTPGDQDVDALTTEVGIGVGSTYDDVKNAYGDRLVLNDDVCGPVAYVIPEGEDDVAFRMGLVFERETAEPGQAQLVALHAGASPGC